jgi:glyoxylase-like metal-dependent hydrolase (beta-lactamase superfamily II)
MPASALPNIVDVLLTGWVRETAPGRSDTGATVTLIRGSVNILVDTGDVSQHAALVEALRHRDLAPDRIAFVVNTHGHLDHVGCNSLFPHATFILDDDIACDGEYRSHLFADAPFSLPAPTDAPITVIATPGHTDHDRTVLVTTPDGIVAIAGDLFECAGDDTPDVWSRWSHDAGRQRQSRAMVRSMADHIVPGHGAIFPVRSGSGIPATVLSGSTSPNALGRSAAILGH